MFPSLAVDYFLCVLFGYSICSGQVFYRHSVIEVVPTQVFDFVFSERPEVVIPAGQVHPSKVQSSHHVRFDAEFCSVVANGHASRLHFSSIEVYGHNAIGATIYEFGYDECLEGACVQESHRILPTFHPYQQQAAQLAPRLCFQLAIHPVRLGAVLADVPHYQPAFVSANLKPATRSAPYRVSETHAPVPVRTLPTVYLDHILYGIWRIARVQVEERHWSLLICGLQLPAYFVSVRYFPVRSFQSQPILQPRTYSSRTPIWPQTVPFLGTDQFPHTIEKLGMR